MTRQYFCWKVCLTFRCGCSQYTQTTHLCGPDREGCNNWMTYKRTDKDCDEHRGPGWGLEEKSQSQSESEFQEGDSSSNSSNSGRSSPLNDQREVQGEGYPGGQGREVGGAGEGKGDGAWEGCYARRRV